MLAAVHEKGWLEERKEEEGRRRREGGVGWGRKFSFGEKPVRLKGRKVEEAEETNKERKGGGEREKRAEQAIHGCK